MTLVTLKTADWRPLGVIALTSIRGADRVPPEKLGKIKSSTPYVFLVSAGRRNLYCQCTCESEVEDWVSTLKLLLQEGSKPT